MRSGGARRGGGLSPEWRSGVMNGKTITSAFILALGCILAGPALASDYKCTATTQE